MALQMPSTNKTQIVRLTKALYDAAPGYTYLTAFEGYAAEGGATGMTTFANWLTGTVGAANAAALTTAIVSNLKMTGAVATGAAAYLNSQFALTTPANYGKVVLDAMNALANLTGDATYGAAATAFNSSVSQSYAYSVQAANNTTDLATLMAADEITLQSPAITLTTGFDNLLGTATADSFRAYIINDANTLQSGDVITGGAGGDSLIADIGSSAAFAITAQTNGVEVVQIRAEATPVDATNGNNTGGTATANIVQIDAQRMEGVTWWESSNSRADLIIEDVRIADGSKTKDVTIAMVETDPGNVDFGVYFDQESLRNSATTSTSLNIKLMDTGAAGNAATAATPLLNNPYDQFKLGLNGVLQTIQLDKAQLALPAAKTYAGFLAIFQAALVGSGITAALGADFTVTDPISNTQVTGKAIVLTGSSTILITAPTGSGWYNTTGAPVPPTSNIYTTYDQAASSLTELVTSTIVLDDVGRGSTGGDLVVGGQSVGATSTSRGVERFEITVNDNSKLQTINSTNDALREVVIINGFTSNTTSNSGVYDATVTNAGNLTVNGNANSTVAVVTTDLTGKVQVDTGSDLSLPGLDDLHHNGAYGFTNVRLIDGSAMTGKLAFTAQVTDAAIAKYITRVDTAADPYADVAGTGNVNYNIKGANFIYSGGAGADTIKVDIDASVAASRSTAVSGQSDFTFVVNGNAGNDTITIDVLDTNNVAAAAGGLQNWAANQDLNDNITINAGDGNDTVGSTTGLGGGAGDKKIDLGAGADTLYSDNTGKQTGLVAGTGAALSTPNKGNWVFNTWDQANAIPNGQARNIFDLRSDANDGYNIYKGTVTVTFKGIPSAAITLANTATYKTTDLEINQAIKNAIINDATLSKLLSAEDGPGNTLLITSKIDGVMTAGDLTVAFAAPVGTTTFSAAEISGMATAYKDAAITTSALALAAMVTPMATFVTNGDYNTALAQDSVNTNIVGAASITTADNFITPGTGDDIIVLGTTVGLDVARSSNEVITLAAGFGKDVIVNFAATGAGIDHLSLEAFVTANAGITVGALSATDNLVTVVTEVAGTNDTDALVSTLVKAAIDAAATGAAHKQVYIVVTPHNVGKVYSITNGIAVGDAVVTNQGTIDLADTAWATLTAANYQTVGAQAEGASSAAMFAVLTAAANNQVLIGTTGIDTLSTGGFTGVTMTGLAGADVFTVIGGSTGASITDLVTGDSFTVTNVVSSTVANTASALTATTTGFTATVATTNTNATTGGQNTNASVALTAAAAGAVIDMSLAGGNLGYTLTGAAGADTLTGSAFADIIVGTGNAAIDLMYGNAGNDQFTVAATADIAIGDVFDGGLGIDTIKTAATTDFTGATITGIEFIDATTGVGQVLTFTGNQLTGTTMGFAGLVAGGLDTVIVNAKNPGDTVNLANIVMATTMSTLTLNGLAGAETLTGAATATIINGNDGNDTIAGGAGDDTLLGGVGDDTISGAAGTDTITGGAGADTLDGGIGTADVVTYADVVAAGSHGLANISGMAINISAAAITAATIATAMGGTIVIGGGAAVAGADLAAGTAGYLATTAGNSTATMVRDTLSNFESVIGSALGDYIAGSAGNDIIGGAAGADTLLGGAGNDTIVGGAGIDNINGGTGADVLTGSAGGTANTFVFAAGDSGLPTATNFDTITDYTSGTDIIDFGATTLASVAHLVAAVSGTASITAGGLAAFHAIDSTDTLRLAAVANAMGADAAGTSAVYQDAAGVFSYLYITDGVAGVGANDVLVKITGIAVGAGLGYVAGDITTIA